MKVLVTGSEGYIGSVLIPMLLERGHEVAGLDAGYLSFRHFVPGIRRIPLMRKDVRDVERADLAGFSAVLHLAALSNDPLGELNPKLTDEINHVASIRIAELARAAGVSRFVFSSSCSIYGAGANEKLDEQSAFNPLTAYARSKVETERDLMPLAGAGFSPVYLRNGTAYGVSPRMRFDLVLNNLTGWAVTTGRVTLQSDGSAWRPLVHIRDISAAFLAVLEAPTERVHNQAFNVGLPEANYQIRTVADRVAHTVPDSTVVFAQGAEADKRNYNVSFQKIHSTLPEWFKPTWDISEGAEELYHACRVTKLTHEEFSGPSYMTIKRLKQLMDDGYLDEDLRWQRGS